MLTVILQNWHRTFLIEFHILKEEFEDTKGVIRIRISQKDRQTTQWPKEKGQKNKQQSTN
jgi:hypothetical protein